MRFFVALIVMSFATLAPVPLWAQDPPDPSDPAYEISLLMQDDARCSHPGDPGYNGEWCKGFRTGATFISLTSGCGFLLDGRTRGFSLQSASELPLDLGPGDILFEAP